MPAWHKNNNYSTKFLKNVNPHKVKIVFLLRYFLRGFTVFYCDTALDVRECTAAAQFFLIAFAQRRDPKGNVAGNRTQDLPAR